MSIYLEMGLGEGGGTLNGSGVEGGMRKVEMRYGMYSEVLQSGVALKAVGRRESVRSD